MRFERRWSNEEGMNYLNFFLHFWCLGALKNVEECFDFCFHISIAFSLFSNAKPSLVLGWFFLVEWFFQSLQTSFQTFVFYVYCVLHLWASKLIDIVWSKFSFATSFYWTFTFFVFCVQHLWALNISTLLSSVMISCPSLSSFSFDSQCCLQASWIWHLWHYYVT